MRKFIIKTLLIVLPFFVSFGCAVFFGAQNKGDLLRMGYLYDNTGDYGDRLIKNHRVDRKYSIVSNLDTTQKTKFKIFTIGDSFSQQDEYGYQNFLAREGVSVLHYFKRGNPIENLYSTLNGDFFEKVSPEYVVLQCVQRQALFRGTHSSSNKVLSVEQMTAFEKQVIENNSSSTKIKLFTDAVIKFPFYNVFHTVSDNAFFSIYDDTHWSPIASKIIAEEIFKIVSEK